MCLYVCALMYMWYQEIKQILIHIPILKPNNWGELLITLNFDVMGKRNEAK